MYMYMIVTVHVHLNINIFMMLQAARHYLREVKRLTQPRSYDLAEELLLWDFRRAGTLEQWDCISDRDVKGNSIARLEYNGKGGVGVISPS